MTATADSPDLVAAKRLLDLAKSQGFAFRRVAPGPDGALRGVRETVEWVDEILLSGFWDENSCHAIRRRRSSLVVPGGLPVAQRVDADALTVLHTVYATGGPDLSASASSNVEEGAVLAAAHHHHEADAGEATRGQ